MFNEILSSNAVESLSRDIDFLVLSCAAYRITALTITDMMLLDSVTNEDYVLANKIEEHFKSKLLISELKGIVFGKFKQDLKKFLFSKRTEVSLDNLPMVASLPKLYHEDISVESITEKLNKTTKITRNQTVISVEIDFVGVVKKYHKNKRYNEYWFKDINNDPYMIEIEGKNSLLNTWDFLISKKTLKVSGVTKFFNSDFQFHKFIDFQVVNV
jgi:hypothetical protein